MQQQQVRNPAREARIDEIVGTAVRTGAYEGKDHKMVASLVTPEVWVRHATTGLLVAYSSTEADRGSSIEEFAADYLV